MKQLLLNSLYSLITGLCFMAGLFIVAHLFEKINQSKNPVSVEQPGGFEFKNDKIVNDQKTFTVEGELFNTHDIKWKNIQIVVSIYAGNAFMTYCRTGLDSLGKKSHRHFMSVCRVTAGSNLPDNISYELEVKRAER